MERLIFYMNKSKQMLIYGIGLVIVIAAITVGLTYAFFTASIEGNETANDTVITTADLRLYLKIQKYSQ